MFSQASKIQARELILELKVKRLLYLKLQFPEIPIPSISEKRSNYKMVLPQRLGPVIFVFSV